MLVTVDTNVVDLVHNTKVLESALSQLPAGWIVELEFFKSGTFSFVKTYDGYFIPSPYVYSKEDTAKFIKSIQGDNLLKKEAMSVTFHEPISEDVCSHQNSVLQEVMDAKNGESLVGGRFIKYRDFFLDVDNELRPVGLLAVANALFMKEYSAEYDFMGLFNKDEN